MNMFSSVFCCCVVVWIVSAITETTQLEKEMSRKFQSVYNVNISESTYLDSYSYIVSRVKCASLCVERGCLCVAFSFDLTNKVCDMFARALLSGNGSSTGFNKITGCASPKVLPNAALRNYTGCKATYDCNFGYTADESLDPDTLTCQSNETWGSDFSCIEIACSSPSAIMDGSVNVAGPVPVGGSAKYTCNNGFINRGGTSDTLTCQLGGTWSGTINVVCKPINIHYRISIRTADVAFAGTAANVYIKLFGSYTSTTINMPSSTVYYIGEENTYQVTDKDVGTLNLIGIGHDNTGGDGPGWKVESVTITRGNSDDYKVFADAWIETPDLYKTFNPIQV